MAGGWIKLHRSALDTVETREPDAFRFWIWLLTNATHSEMRVYRGKGGRPVDLQPGQLVISTANGCDGLSRKRTRSLIERFTNAGMIACETRRDTGHTITIVKWLEYQQEEHVGAMQGPMKGTYNGHTTAIQGPNKGQQHKNDKNDKNDKKEREGAEAPPLQPTRGSFIDPDWNPSEADREYAMEEWKMTEAAVTAEARKFRDYWTSATGANARKRDWSATWRNWVRRANERGGPGRPALEGGKIQSGYGAGFA